MTEHGMGELYGVAAGVIVGLIIVGVFLIKTKTDGGMRCKYDERQMIDRGQAYKYGFWVIIAGNIAYALLSAVDVKLPVDTGTAMLLIVLAGITVHVSYCIWHDAYFALNEHRRKIICFLAGVGIMNLVLGILSLAEGRGMQDGVLNIMSSNLFCGVMFLIIFAVMLLKNRRDWNE